MTIWLYLGYIILTLQAMGCLSLAMETPIICILFVLLDGETRFFQIKAHANSSVFNLKDLILKARSTILSNFNANELLLYQVSLLLPM